MSEAASPARTRPSRPPSKVRPVNGRAVARLRAKFGMSKSRFARLLEVSAPCIGNWERRRGALNLQPRTLEAWNAAKGLTKRQALRKLNGS